MIIYNNPKENEWEELCSRAQAGEQSAVETAREILEMVKKGGDTAIRELALKIDGFCPQNLEVSRDELEAAATNIDKNLKDKIENAISNITAFHKAQMPQEIKVGTAPGVICIQKPVAIQKVGLYIPGGTAPLFSTVLMLAIPAQLAGCKEIVLCTPPDKEGKVAAEVLYAAKRCGVGKIYRIGGAQAIAAMAYGTGTVTKCHKIFGPGNRYVTAAKQLVSGESTAIDMPAGPSEVMVLADASSRAQFVAADLLSQAEHGADSQAMAVCSSMELAIEVEKEVIKQSAVAQRGGYIEKSLSKSRIIVLDSREKMLEFANTYAAEHLIISMEDPWEAAEKITAAGSIFIGNWSPESAGDYASGTNHTLPTSGWARSCSGVNLDSFMKKITIQEITREGIGNLAPTIIAMADAEGLQAHADAVKIRLQ